MSLIVQSYPENFRAVLNSTNRRKLLLRSMNIILWVRFCWYICCCCRLMAGDACDTPGLRVPVLEGKKTPVLRSIRSFLPVYSNETLRLQQEFQPNDASGKGAARLRRFVAMCCCVFVVAFFAFFAPPPPPLALLTVVETWINHSQCINIFEWRVLMFRSASNIISTFKAADSHLQEREASGGRFDILRLLRPFRNRPRVQV